jgi:hypothetical protein
MTSSVSGERYLPLMISHLHLELLRLVYARPSPSAAVVTQLVTRLLLLARLITSA